MSNFSRVSRRKFLATAGASGDAAEIVLFLMVTVPKSLSLSRFCLLRTFSSMYSNI